MNVRTLAVLLLLFGPAAAYAQGFAGLGTEAEDYEPVVPGREITFPEDHGPHPGFRIEWWYLTANLQDAEGRRYGIQWTLFRQALTPGREREGWANQQLWMAHAALTTGDRHESAEKFARGGIGQAGVKIEPFEAWIDDWSLAEMVDPPGPGTVLTVTAAAADFAYELKLRTGAEPVLHGKDGYSVKSKEGQASYYYSRPFLEAEGTLRIGDRRVEVSGQAWMDREWSSQPLSSSQEGWDWFSLHLPGGDKLMLFRLRQRQGADFYAGTWIGRTGTSEPIDPADIAMEPLEETRVAGRMLPTRWRISFAGRGIDVVTEPLNPESWMATRFAYWEGPIRYSGSHEGVGYLEMTGYRQRTSAGQGH